MSYDSPFLSKQDALEVGVSHHRAGRLADAEKCYRRALELDPAEPDAMHLLGSIALAVGRLDAAKPLVEQAIGIRPEAIFYHTLGLIELNGGNFDAAVGAAGRSLELNPNLADAYHLLGSARHRQGLTEAATAAMRTAIDLRPDWAVAHDGLADVIKPGDATEAERLYRRAIELDPNCLEAWTHLCVLLREQKRLVEAADVMRSAVRARPDVVSFWIYLALSATAAGETAEAEAAARRAVEVGPNVVESWRTLAAIVRDKGDRTAAMQAMTRAAYVRPNDPAVLADLGHDLLAVGQVDDAIRAYQHAVTCEPGQSSHYSYLGLALNVKGVPGESLACLGKAIELDPMNGEAYNNLSVVRFETGDTDGAIDAGRRAVELQPTSPNPHANLSNALREVGRLTEALAEARAATVAAPKAHDLYSNLLFYELFDPATTAAGYVTAAKEWAARYAVLPTPAPIVRPTGRPFRIGYVSADFTNHAVGRFLLPIVQGHDRTRFEVHCVSNNFRDDAVTAEFKSAADRWHEVRYKSDEEAERLIRDAGIDVLVDTSAHAAGNRLTLFTRRPAPVQVSYLAYCATTGVESIDYLIVDPHFWPDGSNPAELVEKPLRLPATYWCYRPPAGSPDVGPSPVDRNGFVTFGSFNNVAKLSDECLAAWWRVMGNVPDARMAVYAKEGSPRTRIAESAAAAGVDPGRLSFFGFRPMDEYLRGYHDVDVALDAYPFTGGTTTCDTLWMGVPVVTRTGAMTVSRGSSSLLHNVGLGSLVADSADGFVEIATALGNDRDALRNARADLRIKMQASAVMDEKRFVRDLEQAYLSVLV